VVAQVVLKTPTNMIWTMMPVKKFTSTNVPKNVTMLMNGITHKDLTNAITNVIVMVTEPVTFKDGVKVKPDLKTPPVISLIPIPILLSITLVTKNVMLLLSILNVITWEKFSKLMITSIA